MTKCQTARKMPLYHCWPLCGALLGAAVFLLLYGVQVLNPTQVDWLYNAGSPDPVQHYLGWAFYRHSAVRLPFVGLNYQAFAPYRVSVLFSDSLPLAALLLRPFAALLPAEFQYLGWWGLACYMLQGALGQAVIAAAARCPAQDVPGHCAALCGAGVLVLFPALVVRMFGHTALAGTWLVLLALLLWLQADRYTPTTLRACLCWGGMGLLCAGIHLYYLPMVGMVLLADALRAAWQKRDAVRALLPVAAFCGTALAEILLLGAFSGNFAGYSNGFLDGADLLNLLVPGLGASWEREVYPGLGVVLTAALAVAGLCVYALRHGPAALWAALCRRKVWLVCGALLLAVDLLVAAGDPVVAGGKVLFGWPLPAVLRRAWSMFSSCARLAWLAGMLLAVAGSAAVIRLWGRRAAIALLAVCFALQGLGQRDLLAQKAAAFHDPARYTDQSLLQDDAWQLLAAQPQLQHLALVSFDLDQPAYWDLAAYAAHNGWSLNSFYLAHMDVNLAAATVAGQMQTLRSDTLYAFLEEDELSRPLWALHYYRVDGILLGSVDPLPLAEEPAPAELRCDIPLERATVTAGSAGRAGATVAGGGQLRTAEWTLWPGNYTVTLTGSGFDHSYLYARHGADDAAPEELTLTYTEVSPERMVFTVHCEQMMYRFCIGVHTLDDREILVDGITVARS